LRTAARSRGTRQPFSEIVWIRAMSDSIEPVFETAWTNSSVTSTEVLDLVQLRRIEAVHRGFLYQHLFAAGCLLRLADAGGHSVSVERDEDVEVDLPGRSLYFQIKTRAAVLQRSDVAGALQRFEEIRHAHNRGARSGTAQFRIIANVSPSEVLLSDLNSAAWPADVQIRWPGSPTVREDAPLPPAWSDLAEAVAWCSEAARNIPFAAIAPGTLVWKLAAQVQFSATGNDDEHPAHTFLSADLPILFEQIVEQLQEFPSGPDDYRPQINELTLESNKRICIVAGLSGAGKTTWAAQAVQHCAGPTVYFDVADIPSPAIATSLAREFAARFLGGGNGAARAGILSFSFGLDMLRALDRHLEIAPVPIVVIDNAHRAAPRDLFEISGACSHVCFVFLVQPWPGMTELEALCHDPAEWLAGWDTDTVGAEFVNAGCKIDPATAERWRAATAGMPLFVKNAAHLAANLCGGDAARFADEVDTEAHAAPTVQETILERMIAGLSDDARMALATLSLSTAPLSRDEVGRLLDALPPPKAPWGRSLRELTACGGLQIFANGHLKVHDAVRVLGRNLQSDLLAEVLLSARTLLRDILFQSLSGGFDLVRFGMWLRLLPVTGAFETLVDIATLDLFHEFGDTTDLRAVLEDAANIDELDDTGKFWTLDALAFWDWQTGRRGETFASLVNQMATLISRGTLGRREQSALLMKRMLSAATNADPEAVDIAFREAVQEVQTRTELMRLLKYNYAVALFHLGRYQDAENVTVLLSQEYYEVLGLEPAQVVGVNPPEILAALGGEAADHQDNLKQLGDCLSLYAMSRRHRGSESGLSEMLAFKFYFMAGAYRSAVKAGQEVVDGFLRILRDPEEARQFMERHLLPLISKMGLVTNMVSVRAQYAVVLAYCGYVEKARKEMGLLEPFAPALTPEAQHELHDQVQLIEAIENGHKGLPSAAPKLPAVSEQNAQRRIIKVGRNEPCPCGSGKKYKKCCLSDS
jgi:hypothetical protein